MILLAIAMVGLVVYGLYVQVTSNKLGESVMKDFLKIYSENLNSEQYDKIYAEMTTVDFRKEITLEQYKQAQKENLIKYGKLVKIEPTAEIFNKMKEPGAPWFYRINLDYRGEKEVEKVAFDMVEENGVFKIYRTYKVNIPLDLLELKVY